MSTNTIHVGSSPRHDLRRFESTLDHFGSLGCFNRCNDPNNADANVSFVKMIVL
jgi:hypothetical protein